MRALLFTLLFAVPLALAGCDSDGLADYNAGCTVGCDEDDRDRDHPGDGGDDRDEEGGSDGDSHDDGGGTDGDGDGDTEGEGDGDDDGGDDDGGSGGIFLELDPTATYLRTEGGDALDAPAVLLSEVGLVPGDTACFLAKGDVDFGSGSTSSDLNVPAVLAVFSRTDELLGETEPARVKGALDAGDDIVTPLTNPSELATDIDEDFDATDVCVGVPDDAAYVFFSAFDSYFLDNEAVGGYGIEVRKH